MGGVGRSAWAVMASAPPPAAELCSVDRLLPCCSAPIPHICSPMLTSLFDPCRAVPQQRRRQQRPAVVAAAAAPPGAGPDAEEQRFSFEAPPAVDIEGRPIGRGEIGVVDDPNDYVMVSPEIRADRAGGRLLVPMSVCGCAAADGWACSWRLSVAFHACLALARAGYTPYDLIDFSDIPLKHEVVAKVDRPIRWGHQCCCRRGSQPPCMRVACCTLEAALPALLHAMQPGCGHMLSAGQPRCGAAAASATHRRPARRPAPPARSEVYALWSDRLNWPEWFGMIEELGFSEEREDVVALNMWYRWGEAPACRVLSC